MIHETIKTNLLAIAEAYAKATRQSLATVSREFYGNGAYLSELKRGERESISTKKVSDMVESFREKWPPKTPWPATRPIFMRMSSK